MKNSRLGRIILVLMITIFISLQFRGIIGNIENSSVIMNNEGKNIIKSLNPQSSSISSFDWNKTWGDSNQVDTGNDIIMDGSGNVYITGYTTSNGGPLYDIILLKYNSTGNLLWNRTWGGSDHGDGGIDIITDGLGNIYITGFTESYGEGDSDVILLKYDSTGTLLWNKTWGGPAVEVGFSFAADGSGNIYITGATENYGEGDSDVILLKYNSTGNLLWNRTWGGDSYEIGNGLAADGSGNLYISGVTGSYGEGGTDVFLLKYDSTGNLLWNRTWGGSGSEVGHDIATDGLGSIYITGYTMNVDTYNMDVILLKYDSTGNLIWNRTWGGDSADIGRGITPDGSGNLYISGSTSSYGAWKTDVLLLKYDSKGNLLWNETWGDSSVEFGLGIATDGLGNVYITGSTFIPGDPMVYLDVILLKYTDDIGLVENIPGYNLSVFPWLIGLSVVYLYITKKRSINANLRKKQVIGFSREIS